MRALRSISPRSAISRSFPNRAAWRWDSSTWAAGRSIGFSGIVSIGDALDIDFGDLLDYFALDRKTRAILMYIESISDVRKFMSAARAAARVKPVIVVKAGRHVQAARAAATHTGALAGVDAVYAAAFRRAGLLRVFDLDELFAAAETLGRLSPFEGKRLAIMTNGGGIGVLAVDRVVDLGGTLAGISPQTLAKLDSILPPTWSKSNPVDIIEDADATRYASGAAAAYRRSGERRRAGDERADRACLRRRMRRRGRPSRAAATRQTRCRRSPSWRCGSAMTARRPRRSTPPPFPITAARPMRSVDTCTSYGMSRRIAT